jgi:SAM-dependent methyltransferase
MRSEVKYFNDKSKAYREEYDRETPEGYSFRVRREKCLALTPDHTNVIDIASGPGVMIQGLRAKNCTVTCVDAAPEMIARAKEEFPDSDTVRSMVGDAYGLDLPAGTYDIALAMGLIEYLEDEGKFLEEAKRLLKPGGSLIVTFPNYVSPWRACNRLMLALVRTLRALLHRQKPVVITHREYTLARAERLLAAHGFTAKRTWYYNFKLVPYPFDVKFPRLTVALSKVFEHLDRLPILRSIGTGFIVKATRN